MQISDLRWELERLEIAVAQFRLRTADLEGREVPISEKELAAAGAEIADMTKRIDHVRALLSV